MELDALLQGDLELELSPSNYSQKLLSARLVFFENELL
jgi:hypothetical protein